MSAAYNQRRQGSMTPASRGRVCEPRTPFVPKAQSLRKAWRSLGSPTPDTAVWGHSPDVPVWRDGDRRDERGWLVDPLTVSLDSLKRRSPSGPWKLRLFRPPQFQHGSLLCSRLSEWLPCKKARPKPPRDPRSRGAGHVRQREPTQASLIARVSTEAHHGWPETLPLLSKQGIERMPGRRSRHPRTTAEWMRDSLA